MTKEVRNAVSPLVKWAGGKRKIAPRIVELLKLGAATRYIEPYAGGAAVAIAVRAMKPGIRVELGDALLPLVEMYRAVLLAPREVGRELMQRVDFHMSLDEHGRAGNYYEARHVFNEHWRHRSPTEVTWFHDTVVFAARFLFLNYTCFNGLWRTSNGKFNVPYGKVKKFAGPDGDRLAAWASHMRGTAVTCEHFQTSLESYEEGCAIYADPPYHSEGDEAFTGYSGAFGIRDQELLCARLTHAAASGARCVASNRATPEIVQMYGDAGWTIERLGVRHCIGAKGNRRSVVDEVLMHIGPGVS